MVFARDREVCSDKEGKEAGLETEARCQGLSNMGGRGAAAGRKGFAKIEGLHVRKTTYVLTSTSEAQLPPPSFPIYRIWHS